jgi:hypothetical protein
LINALSERFGAQCVVVGVDSQTVDGLSRAAIHRRCARTRDAARSTVDWVIEAQQRGAGEIVLNCMSSDGVRRGYDIAQLRAVRECCRCPWSPRAAPAPLRILRSVSAAHVDAALAASVFHSGEIAIPDLKRELRAAGIEVRPMTLDLDWDKGERSYSGHRSRRRQRRGAHAWIHESEALAATEASGRVTFWSRSKGRLWTKGETSGHFLEVKEIAPTATATAC